MRKSAEKKQRGQVILEFTFCMIIVFLMIYGVAKAFVWTGRDFAERARAHDERLLMNIETDYGRCTDRRGSRDQRCHGDSKDSDGNRTVHSGDWVFNMESGPLRQIDPYFYTPTGMDAVWNPAGDE